MMFLNRNLLITLTCSFATLFLFTVSEAMANPRGACITGYSKPTSKFIKSCRDNVKNTRSACTGGANAQFYAGRSCSSLGYRVRCGTNKTRTSKDCRHNKKLDKKIRRCSKRYWDNDCMRR